jgi:hypothetical protein
MIVRETVQPVVERAAHVSIDDDAIRSWAGRVDRHDLRPACHDLLAHLPGSQEKLANLVLLIDALNFCFWSANPIRFEWRGRAYERFNAMFVSLMLAARYDPRWFDAAFWVDVPAAELRETLAGRGELLLMAERERIVRETGRVLLERFDGDFVNAVDSVGGRAWPLAVLLMTNFDSFRDVASYHGQPVYFMKRAQICALDLAVAWQTHDHPPLEGLEELTAFADYRVPQALRHLGILRPVPLLAQAIDTGVELPAGSPEEVELRAASIAAVERMAAALAAAGKKAAEWEIDWYLWSLAHAPEVAVQHHRTRTVYY